MTLTQDAIYHISLAILIVWLYENFQQFQNGDHAILNTTLGVIRGLSGDGYYMYLGIPYARVNRNNPFGESLPHPKFEGIFDATDDSKICPQIKGPDDIYGGTLDCLWLHIYVPKSATTNLLPILVWFPGGRFKFGDPGRYIYGPKFLTRQDIIVVTVSSRLGPYGFLCLGTPEVPGNQGLKDQVAALRWIKKHIKEFGGNPDEVTVAGVSSSAFGVDFLLRSNLEGLFNKAIIQSGTVEFSGVIERENHEYLFSISRKLGLDTNDTVHALNFLMEQDPKTVIEASDDLNVGPCVERRFDNIEGLITIHPMDNPIRKAKDISVLIGTTNNERLCSKHELTVTDVESANSMVREKLSTIFDFGENEDEIVNIIRRFYLKSDTITKDLVDFHSDLVFYHPTRRFVKNYLKSGGRNIFHYVFSYVGTRNFMRNMRPVECAGAAHADELGYLFDVSYYAEPPSQEDQVIIDRITTLWANFVKYGDPTPVTTELLPVKWLPVTERKSYYLNITTDLELKTGLYHERMSFWDVLYNKYGKFVIR